MDLIVVATMNGPDPSGDNFRYRQMGTDLPLLSLSLVMGRMDVQPSHV